MELNTIQDLVGMLTHNPSKMKVILFLSKEEEISKDLVKCLSSEETFKENSPCRLGFVFDEAEAAEDIFPIFKVEYVPTCLILNSDFSVLGNYLKIIWETKRREVNL